MANPKSNPSSKKKGNDEKTKKNKTAPASAGRSRGKRAGYKIGGNREFNKIRNILNTANPHRADEARQWAENRGVVGIFEKVLRTKKSISI